MSRLFGLVLILLVAAAQSLASANWSYGLLRLDNSTDSDTLYNSTEVTACSESAGLSVCIGCKTYSVCTGGPNADLNIQETCPTDRPYCQIITGECDIEPDNTLRLCGVEPPTNSTPTQMTPDFKCTGIGNYPDPYSCSKYYFCETAGDVGDPYECAPNYSYNVTSQNCQLMDGGCKPINCSDSEFIFNEYPTDPQYFYYCKLPGQGGSMPETLPTVYMFSCGSGFKFDVCTEQCVFRCTQEGLFAKSSDPNKYYQCYMEDGALKYVERSCPVKSQAFDEKLKFCIYQSVK